MQETCPECGDTYETRYDSKDEAEANDDQVGIEQFVTGLCSRRCYLAHVGSLVEDVDDVRDQAEIGPVFLVVEEVDDSGDTEVVLDGQFEEGDDGTLNVGQETFTEDGLNTLLSNAVGYVER